MMTKEVYRPKCIVKYSRLAFTVPTNDIRDYIGQRRIGAGRAV